MNLQLNFQPFPRAAFRQAPRRRPLTVAAASRPELLTAAGSRGQICLWYIKEAGLESEVDVRAIDMKEKEHKSDAFLKINPFGKVPALVDGDLTLYESGAIMLYLADKFGKLPTVQDRAKAAKWLLFANSTYALGVFVEAMREKQAPQLLQTLDQILSKSEYIESNTFTISDVAIGSYLLFTKSMLAEIDFAPYPHLWAYMQRLAARPAAQATLPSATAAVLPPSA